MATYAGNASLSTAVKDRVISTFQQTLSLYKQGRMDDVIAGCGLILRMDPMFDPAKKLMQKAQNPALPIDVDSLLPANDEDALVQARAAMAARDYQSVVNITTEVLTNDLMNDEARILGDEAREKMEAAPFVEQFYRKFEQHLSSGNAAAAKTDLEKARALDNDHPAIARMEQMLSRGASGAHPAITPTPAPPAAPSTPSFSFDGPAFVVDPPAPAAQPSGAARGPAVASDFGFSFEEDQRRAAAPAAPAAPQYNSFSFDSPAAPAPPTAPAPQTFSFDSPAPAPPPAQPKPAPAPQPPPAAPAQPASPFSFGDSGNNDPFAGFSFGSPDPAPAAPPPPSSPSFGTFSFDAPPPAAPAPAAPAGGGFDFSSASFDTSPDDQRKIQQYMADGDRAFEAGEYQQAIDLWSRIFLIDVTNEQASERIERAKQKRREIEQKVEGVLATAIAAYDRKDLDNARQKFNEVLRVDPANSTAQDYLERLSENAAPAPSFGYEPPSAPSLNDDLFSDEAVSGSYEAPLVPPDPDDVAAPVSAKGGKSSKKTSAKAAAAPATGTGAKKKSSAGLAIAAVVVLALLGGGWFAFQKYMAKPAVDPATSSQTITQAQALAQRGKYDQAIALLQDIKPDDPQHEKALGLMADYQHKKAQASEMVDGRPAAVVYQENLANGKAAYESHDYLAAKNYFEAAQHIKPLPADMQQLAEDARQQSAKLEGAKTLFKERKYQDALTSLAALAQSDPQNKSIQRMMIDAHFNLGAAALQEERAGDAIGQFDEVLKLDPNDELAKRSRDLAQKYANPHENKDLLYKIYVKYLPLRQVG